MKKKIYFFYPNIINDGIKRTFKVYSNFLKKKYDIYLVTASNKNLLKDFPGIKIIKPKLNSFSNIKLINNILCAFKIMSLNKDRITVISLDDHFVLLFLKLIMIKFKLIIRTPNPIYNIFNKYERKFSNHKGYTNKFEIYFYKFADLVITYSNHNKLSLIKKFGAKNTVHINNFFEKKIFKKKKIKKTYNIFFIGRFVESKDPIFFLKNVLKLKEKININVFILGEGELLDELKKISKNNKNINFLKFTNNPFKKYHEKIDLLCVTSKFDGTPNVLGEAIAHSIPCVAPRNVGLANVLLKNGKGGYLYKQGNNRSFQEKVHYALKNYKKTIQKSLVSYDELENFSKENTLFKLDYQISKLN